MVWDKFKSLQFIPAVKFQNLETKTPSRNPEKFPVLFYGAQTRSFQGKEQMIVPIFFSGKWNREY